MSRLQKWLDSVCGAAVPHPPAGALVRAVWRRPGWLPHRDGAQEGGGAQPAAAGGGVTHRSPLNVLSKPGVRRLTCAHHHRLSSLPSWTHSAYQGGWTVSQVCSQTPHFTSQIFCKCLNVQPLLEISWINPEYCSATVSGFKCMMLISSSFFFCWGLFCRNSAQSDTQPVQVETRSTLSF